MNMNIIIKMIDAIEWADYKEIKIESVKKESSAFGTTLDEIINFNVRYWIEFLNDKNNIVLIAYDKSNPIGLIRAALIDEDVEIGAAFIGSLYVNKDYRQKGLSQNLINTLINEILKYNVFNAVRLWVNQSQMSAINLYTKLSFKLVKKEQDECVFEKVIR